MPESRGEFTFAEVLPRIVALYESGRLVPFIGAGMSMPNCRGWEALIVRLEAATKSPGPPKAGAVALTDGPLNLSAGASAEAEGGPHVPTTDTKPKTPAEALIRRANAVTRQLKSGAPDDFETALESALFDSSYQDHIPPQTSALAAIWWPLVLTTNYDNFYVDAFSTRFDPAGLRVVGRSPEDCQRVLTSLSTAGRAILWALQGHLARPCTARGDHGDDVRLAKEIVLDHAEYRRVTYREPHFRRAFAEVCRQRSLEAAAYANPRQQIFLNLSPAAASDPEFLGPLFQEQVQSFGIEPDRIVLEITERTYAVYEGLFREVLARFRQQNFRIAVDDVGTGYSNLSSLAEIEPDYLKFDNVFVRGIDRRRVKQDLLEALMSFARKMKTKVIAEGIESKEELKVLQNLGVPYGQGFLLARPMPLAEIENVQRIRF